MKNKMKKVVLSTLLFASSLMASDVESLVGIEAGYSILDVERTAGYDKSEIVKYDMMQGGLKIGAQNKDYRVFLGARYLMADDFDYATTYGASLQYLMNMGSSVNFFIGINTGYINIRYKSEEEDKIRIASDVYLGGDAGINLHLGDSVDMELGARLLTYDVSNKIGDKTVTFDNIMSGYFSLIYRFELD